MTVATLLRRRRALPYHLKRVAAETVPETVVWLGVIIWLEPGRTLSERRANIERTACRLCFQRWRFKATHTEREIGRP